MEWTKGFVTIATGHDRYYIMARNLLRSYRYCAKEPYPFAIIADRRNVYTDEFDEVRIISDPHHSYMDKLKLFRELPFDETIFIDADSLAYGDINSWWNIFAEAGDFSLFGYAWRDLDSGRGWFVPKGMNEYRNQLSFIPDFNGGVYYLRNSAICQKVFDIAIHTAQNYKDYQFRGFSSPADEPLLALGMAVCNCEPINLPEICFAPRSKDIVADIAVPSAIYSKSSDCSYPVRLVHWSNYRTRKSLYRFEVSKLEQLRKNSNCINSLKYSILYQRKLLYWLFHFYDITAFVSRVMNKIKRTITKAKNDNG